MDHPTEGSSAVSTPEIAASLPDAFADLQRSREQNDRGPDFREVLGDTADLFVVRRHGSDAS